MVVLCEPLCSTPANTNCKARAVSSTAWQNSMGVVIMGDSLTTCWDLPWNLISKCSLWPWKSRIVLAFCDIYTVLNYPFKLWHSQHVVLVTKWKLVMSPVFQCMGFDVRSSHLGILCILRKYVRLKNIIYVMFYVVSFDTTEVWNISDVWSQSVKHIWRVKSKCETYLTCEVKVWKLHIVQQ